MNDATAREMVCVLSAVLGNRILSTRIAEAVEAIRGPTRRLWFDSEVYRKYPAGPLTRRISALESLAVARRWLRAEGIGGAALVNGYSLAMAARWERVAVATDITPALLRAFAPGLPQRAVARLLDYQFARFAPRAAAWLPISETVKRSLIEDYGVPAERCFVTRAPQPKVDPAPHEPSGRLLFVGNDFARKGGPELLEVFRQRLLPECHLTVVSNDPAAKRAPDAVRVISGIHDPAELEYLYRRADLLVLPTHFDCYSNVICEAAAYGVPAVSTRIGSVGELLDEAGGMSLPAAFTLADIALTVRMALGEGYLARAERAAQFAREKLTMRVFEQAIRGALERL